jgi:phage shock protein B
MNIPAIAIIAGVFIPIVAIICGTIEKVALTKKAEKSNPDDIKLIQELHQGLSRMEQRIEALETILFDQHRKDS